MYMKKLKQYILESALKGWVLSFFKNFSTDYRESKRLRFLPYKEERDKILEFIESQEKCDKTLYRKTYLDYGQSGSTPVGGTFYEPIISTTESLGVANSLLKSSADTDRITRSDKGTLTKLVIKPGSKSINIASVSVYPEQKEWIACGKFKVISKNKETLNYKNCGDEDFSTTINVITVEQVYDESLTDIFEKMQSAKDDYKIEKPKANTKNTVDENTELKVLEVYEKYKNKGISSPEKQRFEKKGITLDDKFLQPLLSRRIYNNIKAYIDSEFSYDDFYQIVKKHELKIYGAKKFGYPEMDFATKID